MSLSRKELLSSIKSNLQGFFKEEGFSTKRITDNPVGLFRFFRETNYGNEVVEINASNYKTLHGLEATFMVCYKEVTKHLMVGRAMDEKFNLNFTSTLIEPSKPDELYEFTVKSTFDVERWSIDYLIPYFRKLGKSFFEKFDDLEKINVELNKNPKQDNAHINSISKRAEIGLIVAKLTDYEPYDTLSETYYKILKKEDIHYEYENVMNYLKTL